MLEWVCAVTGAESARRGPTLQRLWSGYGEIVRVHLEGAAQPTIVVKRVTPPTSPVHNGAARRSHERKLRSYAVEAAWYRDYAARLAVTRVARCHGVRTTEEGWLFALEDLDAAGFPGRRGQLRDAEVLACLSWLAALHAQSLGQPARGLWEQGTYWHLATRPDELDARAPGPLRDRAEAIDAALRSCEHRTLVHGDAKVANFCFPPEDGPVAAVDFQYVGGGCGMRDVAYLLSCLGARACRKHAERWLDHYFTALAAALADTPHDAAAVEREWRALYPLAWADFARFFAGWAPSHARLDAYSEEMTRRALGSL